MPFVSYSQNREDVVLRRVFATQPCGFYIDVGANDPVVASVTKGFYELGWQGINIEPVYSVFQRLQADRPRDINLNVGISNCSKVLPFFECTSATTLSTFCAADAEYLARQRGLTYYCREVPVTTLAEVCARHVRGDIDFLSIDAENLEREVIEGNDWTRWRPKVLVVEDSVSSETGLQNHDKWEPLLVAADYVFGLYDGINRFYVRREDVALLPLLQVPANVRDDYITYEVLCLHRDLEAALYPRNAIRIVARKLKRKLAHYPRLYAATRHVAHLAFPGPWKSRAA